MYNVRKGLSMQNEIIVYGILLFVIALLTFLWLQAQKKLQALEEKYKVLEDEKNDLRVEYAMLHSKYEQSKQSSSEKLQALQDAKNELSKEFKLLSSQIFEEKSKQFSLSSKEQLELLLQPFREQISSFTKQTQQRFSEELKERHQLKSEVLRLTQMSEQLSQDAINLTNALKGENKTQGNWGELVLENILEQSGLREGSEYELQATLKSDEGKTYRPDVIVHMPQKRDIIIDSKVSLRAYEQFMSSEDEHEKKQFLKEHIRSIKSHIKGLSEKKYEKLEGVHTLDFVLLFMPIEGAFLLALEHDGEFFKDAYEQNILVVSPSTLLVTLRTIEHIWRTQHQEEHAKKIAQEAEAMLDKLAGFVENFKKIEYHIQKAQESYATSLKQLSTGRGNVLRRAEKIRELGVKSTKTIALQSEDDE